LFEGAAKAGCLREETSMSWLIPSSSFARAVASRVHTLQRQAARLAAPRTLRLAQAGVLRVITAVAGH
jgi:hypothetical protein